MAISIFKHDKIAYAFTNALNYNKTLSHQLQPIRSKVALLKSYVAHMDGSIGSFFLFEQDPEILSLEVVNRADGISVYKKHKKGISFEDIEKIPLSEEPNLRLWSDEGIFLYQESFQVGLEKYFLRVTYKSSSLYASLINAGDFSNLLLSRKGELVLGNSSLSRSLISSSVLTKIVAEGFTAGTMEVMGEKDNSYLLSYSKIDGIEGYYILTALPKSIALSAVDTLLNKSKIFLLAIFCACIVISILSSNRLTSTLHRLYLASVEIQSENFDFRVESSSRDEVNQLAVTFNKMTVKIKDLLSELKRHNEMLEATVEQRTKELKEALDLQRTMIDNVGQGFFMFNQEGRILPIFSKVSVKMYGLPPEGKYFHELLGLDHSEVESFNDFYRILFDNHMPFEDLILLSPQSLKTSNGMSLKLSYSPVFSEDEKLEKVVVVSTDITQEVAAREEARSKEAYVNLIFEMFTHRNHIVSLFQFIRQQANAFLNGKCIQKKEFLHFLHTVKGNAGVFSMTELRDYVHDCEERLKKIEQSELQNLPITLEVFTALDSYVEGYLRKHQRILGIADVETLTQKVEISKSTVVEFFQYLKKHNSPAHILEEYINSIYAVPLEECLNYLSVTAKSVASTLNKKVNLTFDIEGVKVIGDLYKGLFETLVHLVTNSVYHGIEEESVREEIGKNREGQIRISAIKQRGSLVFRVEDDGRGIDTAKLRSKLSLPDSVSDEEVMIWIFNEGVSTSDSEDVLAGRGVGLNSVAEQVGQLGGRIKVASKHSQGSCFIIEIPWQESLLIGQNGLKVA